MYSPSRIIKDCWKIGVWHNTCGKMYITQVTLGQGSVSAIREALWNDLFVNNISIATLISRTFSRGKTYTLICKPIVVLLPW